jgi:hypothetical protein
MKAADLAGTAVLANRCVTYVTRRVNVGAPCFAVRCRIGV